MFAQRPNRHVVLDDVFQPSLLRLLRQVADGDGEFSDNLKLRSASKQISASVDEVRGRVRADVFAAAPELDQFIKQRLLTGARPGREDSAPMRAERLVRQAMISDEFLAWLGAICTMDLTRAGGINLKLHGLDSLLRKHSDARRGRKLCMVHYLHDHWEARYGGRFLLHRNDGTTTAIDPLPNRMILFDVTEDNFHEIEPLGPECGSWVRINYSAWFG